MEKFLFSGKVSFTVLPTLALAACAGSSPSHFVGTLTPQAGVCEPASTATLNLREGEITFTPNEGTFILRGQSSPNEPLTAVWVPPRPLPGQRWRFTATATGPGTISGTYTTPRCTYAVTLWRR